MSGHPVQQQQQQDADEDMEQQTNSARTIEQTMQAISKISKGLESLGDGLSDAANVLAATLAKIDRIIHHTSAANNDEEAWRVALHIVDDQRIPEGLARIVAAALATHGKVASAAQACSGLISALTQLKQHIWAHKAPHTVTYQDLQEVSLASVPIQLLEAGLMNALEATLAAVGHQRESASRCALQHGADCTGRAAAAAPASQDAQDVPAAARGGGGCPCRSCMLAHAELLSACSALLRYYPTCLLHPSPAATGWVTAAAEAALNVLQDVSTNVLQQQQRQQQQPAAPPAELLQAGLAALDLLSAVCFAPADLLIGIAMRMHEQSLRCERRVLDHPAMLPSMLATTAAAVFGREMQRRLCKNTAAGDGSNSSDGSYESTAAGAAAGTLDAAAVKDQCHQPCQAAPSSKSSSAGSSYNGASEDPAAPAAFHSSSSSSRLVGASEAAWRLVCVTEQWSGGQLLPEPFTLLLESLTCSPKAFLWLACVWQQQQQQQQQANKRLAQQQQQQQQQQRPESSSLPALLDVLHDVSTAHKRIWVTEGRSLNADCIGVLQQQDRLDQRLHACVVKGQHQHQPHTAQHLYMGLLTMRWAVRSCFKGMFQRPPEQDTASSPASPAAAAAAAWQRHGRSWLRLEDNGVVNAARHAAHCLSVWCCWAGFEQQQQQQQQGRGAGVSGQPPVPWGLGQVLSNAVLLEVLQGQCLLLREAARELQVMASSSSTAAISSAQLEEGLTLDLEPGLSHIDQAVGQLLYGIYPVLRALLAAAAVNSRVLEQSAVQLFELAGIAESIVRARGQCHAEGMLLELDEPLLSLLSLLLFPEGPPPAAVGRQQQEGIAAAAVPRFIQQAGLLPYLAVTMPLGDTQHRQLLGLLFSSLKLFSTHPASLYVCSWSESHQEQWLEVAGMTIRAACMTATGLMARGQQGVGGVADGSSTLAGDTSRSSSDRAHRPSSSAQQQQQQQQQAQGSASGPGGSCHSCGLGAEGAAALVPWLVLQGRAVHLWAELFTSYVQPPPPAAAAAAASGKKAGSRSSVVRDQQSQQRNSLAGSAAALSSLSLLFSTAVMPTLEVLAAIVRDDGEPAGLVAKAHAAAEAHLHTDSRKRSLVQTAVNKATVMTYGVPECMWPSTDAASLEQRLVERGQQLLAHCRTPTMNLHVFLRNICSIVLANMVDKASTLMKKSCDTLQELGDGAQEQHRLRQSDIRRYLRSWDVTDATVLRDAVAMLGGSKHSAVDVAIACWLCSGIPASLLGLLQEVSVHLGMLPIHEACNNPNCRTFAGNSEQGLVCGKPRRACLCGGCRAAHYCSRACLKEHWPVHQLKCAMVCQA